MKLCGYKFRKYLYIKRAGTLKIKPELMIVMMNHCSSYSLNNMTVMENVSIDYARVLNLPEPRPQTQLIHMNLSILMNRT